MEPIANDLQRVHSIVNLFISNQLYQQYEFPKRQLTIGKLIGQGAFGQVHQGIAYGLTGNDSNGMIVALKGLKGENIIPYKLIEK